MCHLLPLANRVKHRVVGEGVGWWTHQHAARRHVPLTGHRHAQPHALHHLRRSRWGRMENGTLHLENTWQPVVNSDYEKDKQPSRAHGQKCYGHDALLNKTKQKKESRLWLSHKNGFFWLGEQETVIQAGNTQTSHKNAGDFNLSIKSDAESCYYASYS